MPYCVGVLAEDVFAHCMRNDAWTAFGDTEREDHTAAFNLNLYLPAQHDAPQWPPATPQSPHIDPWVADFIANVATNDGSFFAKNVPISPAFVAPAPSQQPLEQNWSHDTIAAEVSLNQAAALQHASGNPKTIPAPVFSASASFASQSVTGCLLVEPERIPVTQEIMGPLAQQGFGQDRAPDHLTPGLASFFDGLTSFPAALVNQHISGHDPVESQPDLRRLAETRTIMTGPIGALSERPASDLDKNADRRRRNREASSRAYYNRKKRVESLEEKLRVEKRKVTSLYTRQLQLRKESAILKSRVLNL
jgi:hypothetical protein